MHPLLKCSAIKLSYYHSSSIIEIKVISFLVQVKKCNKYNKYLPLNAIGFTCILKCDRKHVWI